ncbi:Os07g0661450, partial [Oryza sativa Japonica Group]
YLICGPCAHFDIKFIFCGGGSTTVACHWGPRTSPRRCTAARAWRTPTKSNLKLLTL